MTTNTATIQVDALLNERDAATVLGLGNPRTLAAWRLRRQGPAFHRVGHNVRYRRADLEAYLKGCRIDPQAKP
jgi:hypothetical protein